MSRYIELLDALEIDTSTVCEECGGSCRVGPDGKECPTCAGQGKVHDGCAQVSYKELVGIVGAALQYHWSEVAGNVVSNRAEVQETFDRLITGYRWTVGLSGVAAGPSL